MLVAKLFENFYELNAEFETVSRAGFTISALRAVFFCDPAARCARGRR